MRAAIYARFSSELQDPRSIDDQIALCRAYAAREGLQIVAEHSDRARSGASLFGRPGLGELMLGVRSSPPAFDVVVVEALDRLSRDQEDLAGLWKRLSFAGIEIRAVHEGRADAIQIGVRGLVGALYLSDLADKVRRGQAGRVREGKIAGGRLYGYRPVPGKPGEHVIDAAEAEIVRRIFAEYAAGSAPRSIAAGLNRDRIPPPRGARWNASTLNGSGRRGAGILNSQLYSGRIVWNKVKMLKDPETGKRVSRPNPRTEWLAAEAPHLRIVDPALAEAVAARRARRAELAPVARRSPKHLLSGLLRCGACGAGMAVHDRDRAGKTRIRCSAFTESRSCAHSRTYYLASIERVVLDGLKENLADPRAIAEFVKVYGAERRRLAGHAGSERAKRERRLAELTRQIERVLDAICEGTGRKAEMSARLEKLGAEKDALQAELARPAPKPNVVALHPEAVARYLRTIEDLRAAMRAADGTLDAAAAKAFRALVATVTVHPVAPRAPLDLELQGRLAALLEAPQLPPSARLYGVEMVAEGRYGGNPTQAGSFDLRLAG